MKDIDPSERTRLLTASLPSVLGFFWSFTTDAEMATWTDDFFSHGHYRLAEWESYRKVRSVCVERLGPGYRCNRTFYSYALLYSTPWGPDRGEDPAK